MKNLSSLQTRVAIVDDHRLVSASIKALIEADSRFSVVACVHDADSAEPLFVRNDIDVVLLDLEMPGRHGMSLLQSLNGGAVACILSIHTDTHFVTEAIRGGARGYISKQSAPEELIKGLLEVSRGVPFYSSDVQSSALSTACKNGKSNLTAREMEVLRLNATGATSLQVATKLQISRRTAEAHRANLMKKLALKTQTDLIRYALRQRIINPD
jgi:DNA-binding NarL/FixJ family response regulator